MPPWTYPQGFHCPKCHNEGYKPNGKSCKDCWARFAKRNNVQYSPAPIEYQQPGLRIPFTNMRVDDNFNFREDQGTYTIYQPPPVPVPVPVPVPAPVQVPQQSVPPPLPPSYDMYQKVPQAPPSYYGPPPPPPMNYYPPPPPPPMPFPAPSPFPRVVNPGDPSLGGVLCGRCRGSGYTGGFMLGEETCNVCGGTGRIF